LAMAASMTKGWPASFRRAALSEWSQG
jgi:hypothetical protein